MFRRNEDVFWFLFPHKRINLEAFEMASSYRGVIQRPPGRLTLFFAWIYPALLWAALLLLGFIVWGERTHSFRNGRDNYLKEVGQSFRFGGALPDTFEEAGIFPN